MATEFSLSDRAEMLINWLNELRPRLEAIDEQYIGVRLPPKVAYEFHSTARQLEAIGFLLAEVRNDDARKAVAP